MRPYERLESETETERAYLLDAPILADVVEGRFELDAYVRFLTNAFHHVKHTVPLMMACGARLPDRLSWMRAPIREYINEEFGHEQWILDDLAVCGVDPHSVATSEPNHCVELLVSYVYDFVNRHNPVGFFGMVHVLEGTSTKLATHVAHLVQRKLGLPDAAFHYLRSHGELDAKHVGFFEQLVDRLTEREDVAAVIHVARRAYRLYGDVIRSVRNEGARSAA